MNWEDTGYSRLIDVEVVDQTNVDITLGALSGVLLSGTSVTENYGSDSRVQGKVTTVTKVGESDGYVKNARLRIVVRIPSREWSRELMTGYVSDMRESVENGMVRREYTVESTLWGLLEHKVDAQIIIAKKSSLITVFGQLISRLTRMQFDTTGAQDHTFSTNVVYEAGTDLATIIFEIASGYDRVDVDGHGRITLKKHTEPSKRSASGLVDYRDVRGLTFGKYEKTSSKYEVPGRAIVTSTKSVTKNGKTSQKVLVGSYDAPSENDSSMASRGYLRAVSSSYSGAGEDPNSSELKAEAKKKWKNQQKGEGEWDVTSVYSDYKAGDILNFVYPQENDEFKVTKVLVYSVNTTLDNWQQKLTLKEV